jgi:hypothetical protein
MSSSENRHFSPTPDKGSLSPPDKERLSPSPPGIGPCERSKQKKMNRERLKRSTLNDMCTQLRKMLALGDNSRVEKLKILTEAINELESLTLENAKLSKETDNLRRTLQLLQPNNVAAHSSTVKKTEPSPMSPMIAPMVVSPMVPSFPVKPQSSIPQHPFPTHLGFDKGFEKVFDGYSADFCMEVDENFDTVLPTNVSKEPFRWGAGIDDKAVLPTNVPKDRWGAGIDDKLLTEDVLVENDEIIDSFFSTDHSFNPSILV